MQTDATVGRLLDLEAIRDLIHRYACFTDAEAADDLVGLVDDDVERVVIGPAGPATVQGREAFETSIRNGIAGTSGRIGTRHHIANVIARFVDDDRAEVAAVGTVVAFTTGEPFQQSSHQADYAFECLRGGDADGWRLRRIQVFTDPRRNAVIASLFGGQPAATPPPAPEEP